MPLQAALVALALPNAAPGLVLVLAQLEQLPLATATPLLVAPVQTGTCAEPPHLTVPTGAAALPSVTLMACCSVPEIQSSYVNQRALDNERGSGAETSRYWRPGAPAAY